jgi:basic membrane protein A
MRRISRREVVSGLAVLLAAACAPQSPAPAPTSAPAKTDPAPKADPAAKPAAASPAAADKPAAGAPASALKIAMVMPGPIQDADFNAVGAQALEEVKRQTGAETAFSESVAVADAERVAREYLNSGFNVVAFHGGQFLTVVQKLAPEFASSTFIIETSGRVPDLPGNVWTIGRKFYQGFYAIGVLAAAASQSKKIGYVAGVRLPDFISSLNAIKQAAKEAGPDVQVLDNFVGDQNDPVKARQTTASLIDSGVDFVIVSVNLGVNGVAEAAKAASKPVLFTTYYTEKKELAPQLLTTSLILDFPSTYVQTVKAIQGGTRGGYAEMRPGSGMRLSDITNVPPDAAARAREAFEAVAANRKEIPEIIDRVVD